MKRHKFNIATYICNNCGLHKRVRPLIIRGGFSTRGFITEYLVNGTWTESNPGCNSILPIQEINKKGNK